MLKNFAEAIDKKVFIAGGLFCLLFLIWTVVAPDQAGAVFSKILSVFSTNFGWLYLLIVSFFIVFLIALAFSKFGKLILGKDGDQPDYTRASWFAMLFAAGMGIGLVFWSVAEPMSHYISPPYGEGSTAESASLAMRYTFTHWGIHPWACYGIIGLPLAYFQFRKDRPALLSSCVEPLIGEKRAAGTIGSIINVLAVFATVFGVATSLGLGAMQINSGLHYVLGIPYSNPVVFGIIAVTTALFVTSAVSGIDKGIRMLSNINIVIMAILLLFVFFAGSTLFVTNFFVDSLGQYFSHLIAASFWTDPFGESNGWLNGWTIFYWAWWISWGPFVGGFIARISKGRTIREFVIGTLACPALVCFIFMAIMGGNAIHFDLNGVGSIADSMQNNLSYALFSLLDLFPLAKLTSFVAIMLIVIFFVTSADSSTFVCSMMTAKGVQNPPASLKVFWGAIEGAVAAVLLYVGGLTALQSAAIIAAFPLMFICLAIAAALVKALRQEIT
ncbi:MAG TPA: BCCT family transporter [Clostridiales bacterium]|nr:BCCT family transporter [Clostridiales bacterium]